MNVHPSGLPLGKTVTYTYKDIYVQREERGGGWVALYVGASLKTVSHEIIQTPVLNSMSRPSGVKFSPRGKLGPQG
jgi:hypothetical protein